MLRDEGISRLAEGACALSVLTLASCAPHGDGTAVAGVAGAGGVVFPGGGAPGGGGIVGVAGFAGFAGARSSVVGGAPGTGGAAGVAAGGTLGAGGILVSGGAPSAGGVPSSSGAPGAGGAVVPGGAGGAPVVLPPGAQQYTFTMDMFTVAPGGEFYECQDQPNPFGADIAIVETRSRVSVGAHHMYTFQIPDTQAACTAAGSTTKRTRRRHRATSARCIRLTRGTSRRH